MIEHIATKIITITAKIFFYSKIYKCGGIIKVFRERVNSEILRLRFKTKHQILIRSPYRIIGYPYIKFDGRVSSLSGLRIECIDSYNGNSYDPILEIGKDVFINQNCQIACINRIRIGNNVLIGSNVLITDHSHGNAEDLGLPPQQRPLRSKGPVYIGDNTWICSNVCVLPDVEIGKNCIIGAGCIVNRNIPDNCIAVGNPVKIIVKENTGTQSSL